jgi:hypothetical protein
VAAVQHHVARLQRSHPFSHDGTDHCPAAEAGAARARAAVVRLPWPRGILEECYHPAPDLPQRGEDLATSASTAPSGASKRRRSAATVPPRWCRFQQLQHRARVCCPHDAGKTRAAGGDEDGFAAVLWSSNSLFSFIWIDLPSLPSRPEEPARSADASALHRIIAICAASGHISPAQKLTDRRAVDQASVLPEPRRPSGGRSAAGAGVGLGRVTGGWRSPPHAQDTDCLQRNGRVGAQPVLAVPRVRRPPRRVRQTRSACVVPPSRPALPAAPPQRAWVPCGAAFGANR